MSAGDVHAFFAREFGGPATVVASAPGRVNLIGEHTDYNGGEVLPIGIASRTYVALRSAGASSRTRLASATEPGRGEFDAAHPARAGRWWDYVAGVASTLGAQRGAAPPAVDLAVWSEVPAAAGLSSSAALEVATALAFGALEARPGGVLSDDAALRELALTAHRAEAEFVGVAVGIMDQFASALARAGHALHIWCDTAEFEHVPMRETVLIFDAAAPRSLRGSAFNTRRAETQEALRLLRRHNPDLTALAKATPGEIAAAHLPPPLDRRAQHVVAETRRVQQMVRGLKAREPLRGDLLLASHASLRDDYEASSPELDWFVERVMREPGVRGARLTGAGWGGCAIAVGAPEALAAAAPRVARDYEAHFRRAPRSWLTNAATGARIEVNATDV
jgi:galactokinase